MWRSARAGGVPSGRVLAGSLLTGAAIFNLFDAIASHWILGLHHIHEGSYETLSDVVYFFVSLSMGLAGLTIARPRSSAGAGPAHGQASAESAF
jgi:uncharacterized membrane protein